jgi:hypothetical protein
VQIIKSAAAGENKTAAEIIVWYWNAKKEIVILDVRQANYCWNKIISTIIHFSQKVHDDFSYLIVEANKLLPAKEIYVVVRLLDKRIDNRFACSLYRYQLMKFLLKSYYIEFFPNK